MKTIEISASKTYHVHIGSGLLAKLGSEASKIHGAEKAMIVSDSHVWPLYGEQASASLFSSGFQVSSFVFEAGEDSKNGATYLSLLECLAENKITRSDLIIALGGGVVGDLAGFAAATYLRGIPFIQVPTTLLAAVDSSVGGKTAIDLPNGKNLAGAFYQPTLVLCDTDTLKTLPDDIFRDGCAEVIKYGILFDPELFSTLCQQGPAFNREAVIARCVELKRDVVAEDEFDTGTRMLLNLGHTIGHAVEAQSQYTISHGKAVAIGTAIISRAAQNLSLCSSGNVKQILSCLELFGLPTQASFSPEELTASALSDKKRSAGTIRLIIPERIGYCRIHPISVDQLQSLIEAGF